MRAAAIFEFKVTQLMGVEEHRVAVSLRTLNKDCE
jgi:predicted transcriptional regulator